MPYIELTERFIASHFPKASVAVIGGSTSRGERTRTSDIDLLLIGDDLLPDGETGSALTLEFEHEIFEVFAYTPDGFDDWAGRSIAQRRPVIVHMLVEGIVVRGEDEIDGLRPRWATVLSDSPSLEDHELEFRRRWIGTGKYLPRRLRELPAARVDALALPYLRGDFDELATAAENELSAAGGRVQAGFVR